MVQGDVATQVLDLNAQGLIVLSGVLLMSLRVLMATEVNCTLQGAVNINRMYTKPITAKLIQAGE